MANNFRENRGLKDYRSAWRCGISKSGGCGSGGQGGDCGTPGTRRTPQLRVRPFRDLFVIYLIGQSHSLIALAFGRIRVLCELLHVNKEPSRLANEKSHGGEECESPRGGAFRVRWSNDRDNREASIQERTRL